MVRVQGGTGGGEGGRIEEFDWDGKLVWAFEHATRDYQLHHDIKPMPNGHVLALMVERKSGEQAVAAGFDPNCAARRLPRCPTPSSRSSPFCRAAAASSGNGTCGITCARRRPRRPSGTRRRRTARAAGMPSVLEPHELARLQRGARSDRAERARQQRDLDHRPFDDEGRGRRAHGRPIRQGRRPASTVGATRRCTAAGRRPTAS